MDRAARRRAQRTAHRRLKRLARLNTRLRALRDRHERTDDGIAQGQVEPYRPPPWMVEFVRARDGACRFPGCTVAARFCDLDHVKPWPGGPTHPDNLVCLCRRHHRIKQRAGWHAVLHPDGSITWTDPTGATRTTTPVDHLQRDTEQDTIARAQGTREDRAQDPPAGADKPPMEPDDADAVAAELPSALEEELEHLHEDHLIALACRPATLTWHTRRALRTGTRISTTRTAAQLHATTRAGTQPIAPRRPVQVDRDSPHWHGLRRRPKTAVLPEDPPPF